MSTLLLAASALLGHLIPQSPSSSLLPTESVRAPVLDAVRFDRPRADEPLWAIGRAWKASFDSTGATVIPFFGAQAPRNFPLRLELAQASVGGEPLALSAGQPNVVAQSVRTVRGPLTEVIDTRLDTLEQSFVFDELPTRGAVTVDVRIDGEFAVTALADGLRFANAWGHVDYTKAVAVDAKGERLPLAIEWTGGAARMVIPAEYVQRAELPLVLDPTINYWYLLASGSTLAQRESDVATIQSQSLGGRTLMIWQRQWSATDTDCWGLMFDGNLGLVATDFAIDFTSNDWVKVAVAGNNYASNFLVVAEIRIGTLSFIGGRLVDANAGLGSVLDIERDGVVGIGGNNHHPDVGGDPYFGAGRYCVVFQKRYPTTADIYFRHVRPDGQLVTTDPIALATSQETESRPSIGKSCGQSNGPAAQWLVTWQRRYPLAPFDEEVYGRFVNWNGVIASSIFGIAVSIAEETAPSAGSPITVDGLRYWPVCYEKASQYGAPRDVLCSVHGADGTMQTVLPFSVGAAAVDDREPEIDSDGTRFVIAYTTGTSGNPQKVEAVTAAYLPALNGFRFEERTNLSTLASSDYGQPNVCASYSGGSAPSPRYFVCYSETTTNTFRLEAFAGHTGTFNHFTTMPSQCGNLSISASGSPVLGQTITVTIGSGGLTGATFGLPGNVPLIGVGCNCVLLVNGQNYFGSPFTWTVPNNPAYVGLPLAVQGWTLSGNQCAGLVDLSDTIRFQIQ